MKNKYWLPTVLVFLTLIISCTNDGSKYTSSVDQEKIDTLFLGLSFGMTRQAFYDTSFSYNAKKLIVNGGGDRLSVTYRTRDGELNYPGLIYYYPEFTDNKISAMPMKFKYYQWAPWNKQMWSDSLILDVKELFDEWYGPGFEERKDKSGHPGFYKKDGPRSIDIYWIDEQYIGVRIEHEQYLKKDE